MIELGIRQDIETDHLIVLLLAKLAGAGRQVEADEFAPRATHSLNRNDGFARRDFIHRRGGRIGGECPSRPRSKSEATHGKSTVTEEMSTRRRVRIHAGSLTLRASR